MPAKGKHRRPKPQRFTRSIAVAGTGGAALALPLMGATGAHAATTQSASQTVSKTAVQSLPVAEKKAVQKSAAGNAGVRTYSVRTGDCLSKIADEQHVAGGWHRLYSDNRRAVGDDPSLIHPGLKLTIGRKAATDTTGSSPSSAAKTSLSAAKATATKASESAPTGFTLPVIGGTIGTGYHVAGSM
ncbi:MAG: LysM peptidoglycan-binding domain-containing protein, partial [Streptomyces sp.]|nr:LysM peptidoglycan-binding domain-containing protein [Streptomyces sp.]